MSIPVIDFSTSDWCEIPNDTVYLEIELIASPPVAANVGLVIFSRPIRVPQGVPPQWTKVKKDTIDNLAYTASTPSIIFSVEPNTFYSFKVQGEAHVLMPGYEEFEIGLRVKLVNGDELVDYDGNKIVVGNAAGIVGVTYLKYGA
jgi:hypothetical protein